MQRCAKKLKEETECRWESLGGSGIGEPNWSVCASACFLAWFSECGWMEEQLKRRFVGHGDRGWRRCGSSDGPAVSVFQRFDRVCQFVSKSVHVRIESESSLPLSALISSIEIVL